MSENRHLIQANQLDEKAKVSMRTRLITAAVLIIVGGACLFLGGYFWLVFITAAALIATYEIVKSTGKHYSWYIYVIVAISTLLFYGWGLLKGNVSSFKKAYDTYVAAGSQGDLKWTPTLESCATELVLSPLAFALCLGAFFLVAILREDFDLRDTLYLFVMSLLVGVGFQSMLMIRYFPRFMEVELWESTPETEEWTFLYIKSTLLMAYVLLTCYLNDAFAYFVGVFFGKHKINPRISPKKTIEGFWGGWIIASIISFAIALLFCAFDYPILSGIIDWDHWYYMLALALLIPGLGNLGDFSFSLIKRNYGIKDYGWIIVGHGGVLDRADSLLFACIGVSTILTLISNGWNII